ncbi:MAG: glycerophosphodiester phosphodiesterase, partial [Chloroflexota bacterium]
RITVSDLAALQLLPAPPPTLVEALDLMRGRALPYLDLRGSGQRMAELVRDALRAGAPDGALLGSGPGRSFAPELALLPGLQATSGIGLPLLGRAISDQTLSAFTRRAIRGARRNGATGLAVEYHLIRPPLLELCRREGFFVFAWTVDDPRVMSRLIALGVDGITTNRPDRLAALLP